MSVTSLKIGRVLLIILFVPQVLMAQVVRVINSTEQDWSGGIAGHHGANYSFTIEFTDFRSEPMPDTLWLKNQCFSIIMPDSANGWQGNAKRIRAKKSVRFQISAGTAYDDYADRYKHPWDTVKEWQPHPPVPYTGVALLSYRYLDKKRYFEIKKIKNLLPPANYP